MTPVEAIDIMCAVFRDAWVAAGLSLDNVQWDDQQGAMPDGQLTWARVTIKHADGPTLGFGTNGARYSNTGTLYVQIFEPDGQSRKDGYAVGGAVVSAYRKAKNEGVFFRNARLKEVGVSGAFQQTNVLTDFIYDD